MRQSGRVNELVAIDLPAGDLVSVARGVWEAGDAVLPLRPADPQAHKELILRSARPTRVISASGEEVRPDGVEVETGDALVVASSGSSGPPKAIVHTWDSIESAAYMSATGAGSSPDSTWLACLPLSHVGGFSVVTRALSTGAGLVVHDGFDAERVNAAASAGATHTSLVPAVLARIQPEAWERILLGGSAIPEDRPANSMATYGMTETLGGVVYDGLALNGVLIRITALGDDTDTPSDPEWDRRDALPGEIGRIEVSSPSLFRGIRAFASSDGSDGFRAHQSRWLETADLGFLDPSTMRLVVVGRCDDLIVTGGHKVWPEHVEEALVSLESVLDIAVCGSADSEWGQAVTAFVVPADPGQPPTLDQLRSAVKESLPAHAAPKRLHLLEQIPRTSLGKPARHSLREMVSKLPKGETVGE